jgi:hypothetical protein
MDWQELDETQKTDPDTIAELGNELPLYEGEEILWYRVLDAVDRSYELRVRLPDGSEVMHDIYR